MRSDYRKLIDDYITGRLSDEERELLERAMDSDPKLRQEVGYCFELKEAIVDGDEIEGLRVGLANARRDVKAQKDRVIKWACSAAAAAIVLLFMLPFISRLSGCSSPEVLFSNNYSSYTFSGITRDSDSTHQSVPYRVVALYSNGEFSEVIPELEVLSSDNPNNYQITLMLASAYLSEGEPYKAENLLVNSKLIGSTSILAEHAEWYLGLALLTQNKIPEAIAVLHSIQEQQGHFAAKALSIAGKLQ